ncbi:MAG TPA: hypothetical protein VF399_11955 [bacterium]
MRKALLLAVALLLVASCSSKVNLFVEGYIERYQTWSDTFWGGRSGDVLSDPILEEMTVTINDDTMEVDLPGLNSYNHDARFWDEDTIPPDAGSEHEFNIQTDVGNASATVTVPGEFDITAPLEDDSIPVDAAYDIAWEASEGADWYMVLIYYSWSGDYKDTLVYVNVDSTTWTIPANWISEDGEMSFYVYAGDGPQIEVGAAGNIKGGKGFCIATNARANHIIVGNPVFTDSRNESHRMSSKDFYRAYIKEMSKYSLEAAEMLEYLE